MTFWRAVLSDTDGNPSSKRVAAFWAMGLLSLGCLVDFAVALWTSRPPSEFVFTSLMVIIPGGLFAVASEWFAPARPPVLPPGGAP